MITSITDVVTRLTARCQGIFNLGDVEDLQKAGWIMQQDVQLDESHYGKLYQFAVPSQAGLSGVSDICFGAAGQHGWVIVVMEGNIDPDTNMSYISPRPAQLAPYYDDKQHPGWESETTLKEFEVIFTELLLANRPVAMLLTLLDNLSYSRGSSVDEWDEWKDDLKTAINCVLGEGEDRIHCIPKETPAE